MEATLSNEETYSVRRPEVGVVLVSSTGEELRVQDVIGSDYGRLLQLRMEVKTSIQLGEPLYLCAECFSPVYLCRRQVTNRFFFRHTVEDGRCGAITRGELSQKDIAARKYNGAKESLLHRRMKQWLEESLRASGRFTDIAQEQRWPGQVTSGWRKPDVSARIGDTKVAFEVQLSTTFLDVIAERRQFYLREGALLFWVFARFDDDGRRLTQDDVFFNNNQNAFLVNENTRDSSVATEGFRLDCVWSEPAYSGGRFELKRQQVSFDELTLDLAKQQAFYFDYAGARSQLEREEAEKRAGWPGEFEAWWLTTAKTYDSLYDQEDALVTFPAGTPVHWNDWGMLAETPLRFYGQEKSLPVAVLDAFFSAKHGRPVGINRKQFIEVAHWFVPAYPQYLLWFRKALQVWDLGDLLKQQDKSGNWAKRVRAYKGELKVDPSKFDVDQQHQRLFEWLFPELLPFPLFVGDDGSP